MRFFSNDAREAPDDQPGDERSTDDHLDRVQSEPVAVPGQRPPSPWATPADAGAPAAVPADNYQREDTPATGAPAYGTVPETVESPSESNTTTYAGSSATDRPAHDDDVVDVPLDDTDQPKGGTDVTDRALKDEGGFDDPHAVEPATEKPLETPSLAPANTQPTATESALRDEGGFDDPQAVDPSTDRPLQRPAETPAPQVTPVPVGNTGAAQRPSNDAPDTLFAAADASGLKERWRDVQLRFVDSPKEATDEAAKLVEEAVDKLTASLRSRKNRLGDAGDDTEALRVQLRGYRDILNRILGL